MDALNCSTDKIYVPPNSVHTKYMTNDLHIKKSIYT